MVKMMIMKKLIKRIALVAVAAVGVVACSQSDLEDGVTTPDSTTESTTETTQPFVLYASTPSDLETKIAFTENEADGSIDLAWENNDGFAIYDSEGTYVGNVYCKSPEDGKFEASSSESITLTEKDSYTALYPIPSSDNYTLTLDEIIAANKKSITNQLNTAEVNDLSSSCLMLAEFVYAGEEDTSIKFAHQMAIMTINFKSALKPDFITFNDGAETTYTAKSFTTNKDENENEDGTFTAHLLINPCDGEDRTLIFSLYKDDDSYYRYCFDKYTVTSSVVYKAGQRYTADVTSLVENIWDGAGTEDDPYLIKDGDDLRNIATKVSEGKTFLSEYFQMTENIDLKNEAFTAIGTSSAPFAGSFDGNNHSISGLNISSESSYQALFGCIKSTNSLISITNLSVSGSVSGDEYVGGIIGYSDYYTYVLNCSSSVTVTGRRNVGGIAGYIEMMSIFYCCYNTGKITSTEATTTDNTGGILGYCSNLTQVLNCYNTGDISGSYTIGGIAGSINESYIVLCYNTGAISAIDYAGGIVGSIHNESSVMSCYNRGTVSGSGVGTASATFTGGVAGSNNGSSVISDCYYDSTVLTGSSAIGDDNSNSSTSNVEGKSTSDMKDASFLTLLNTETITEYGIGLWTSDTDTPQLNDGYPIPRWQVDGYEDI